MRPIDTKLLIPESIREKILPSPFRLDYESLDELTSPITQWIKKEKEEMERSIMFDNTILTVGGKRCKVNEIEDHFDSIDNKWIVRVTAEIPNNVKLVDRFSNMSYDEFEKYVDSDILHTQAMFAVNRKTAFPTIKNVIFNPPATIVFWADNTKTIVQCRENDSFDPEKGLAMAITKKALGNKYEYYNVVKKWLKKAPKTMKKQEDDNE